MKLVIEVDLDAPNHNRIDNVAEAVRAMVMSLMEQVPPILDIREQISPKRPQYAVLVEKALSNSGEFEKEGTCDARMMVLVDEFYAPLLGYKQMEDLGVPMITTTRDLHLHK
jgi:hypothetical protein